MKAAILVVVALAGGLDGGGRAPPCQKCLEHVRNPFTRAAGRLDVVAGGTSGRAACSARSARYGARTMAVGRQER
jgi:hypothetical protein